MRRGDVSASACPYEFAIFGYWPCLPTASTVVLLHRKVHVCIVCFCSNITLDNVELSSFVVRQIIT